MEKKEIYSTNYRVAIEWLNPSLIHISEPWKLDPNAFLYDDYISSDNLFLGYRNEEESELEDDEEEVEEEFDSYEDEYSFPEFYQFFITSLSRDEVEYLCENFSGMHFAWSEPLESWILCVSHYETMWSGVMIDTVLPQANAEMGQYFHVTRELK